jgi:hypothetical protein
VICESSTGEEILSVLLLREKNTIRRGGDLKRDNHRVAFQKLLLGSCFHARETTTELQKKVPKFARKRLGYYHIFIY